MNQHLWVFLVLPLRRIKDPQFSLSEEQFPHGVSINVNSFANPDHFLLCIKSELNHIINVVHHRYANGSQPGVVGYLIRNEQSVHLKHIIADEVKGQVRFTLYRVAEDVTTMQ